MSEFRAPLSQVVFLEDYLQLVFQEQRLSVFGHGFIWRGETELVQSEAGFCDALVGLIGQQARIIPASARFTIEILFQGGTILRVQGDSSSPEAYLLTDETDRMVVGRATDAPT